MDCSWILKLITYTYFVVTLCNTKYLEKIRTKRQYYDEISNFIIPNGEGTDFSEWSEWSSPSECSRSCGGGVAFQTRECLRSTPDGYPQCTGGNKKYFSCNVQDCPRDEPDFRSQQCSRFNDVAFEGVFYEWIPYTKAPNPCELNCMPKGERFYYRHKAKVIDGTRCNDESLDVCVDGKCEKVGCDKMLGSTAREDKCRKCAGDGRSCRTVSGTYDANNLQVGYNDILLVPAGATNILIRENAPSNNYLACRNLSGHYYLNGNWKIDFPRPMQFAGSWWHYDRKPQGFAAPDSLTCLGPTTEAIYVVLLYQDTNYGIQYEYSIPESTNPPATSETYAWSSTEFGPCSATCGEGHQIRNVTCNNMSTLETVDDGLCDSSTMPESKQRCIGEKCGTQWVEGKWGKCSKPCGEGGKQQRNVTCKKFVSNDDSKVVDDAECVKAIGEKPPVEQECNTNKKYCPIWHIGPWKPCSRLCGEGVQTRKVICYKKEGGKKIVIKDSECEEEKPPTEQTCMMRPCEGVDWVASSWSGCKCGVPVETRTVYCTSKTGKIYNETFCPAKKPELERQCKGNLCEFQWFTSEWSNCSADCGKGIRNRIVICGHFDGKSVTPAPDDSKCKIDTKPNTTEECEIEIDKCPSQWFTGPWGTCDKKCGGGERHREVICLSNGKPASNCDAASIEFSSEKCNTQPCDKDEMIPVDTTGKTITDEEYEEECEDEEEEGEEEEEMLSSKALSEEETEITEDKETTKTSSFFTDELMLSDATGLETMETEFTQVVSSETSEASGDGTGITEEGSGEGTQFISPMSSTETVMSTSEAATDQSSMASSLSSEVSPLTESSVSSQSESDLTPVSTESSMITSQSAASSEKETTGTATDIEATTLTSSSSSSEQSSSTESSSSTEPSSSTETSSSTEQSSSSTEQSSSMFTTQQYSSSSESEMTSVSTIQETKDTFQTTYEQTSEGTEPSTLEMITSLSSSPGSETTESAITDLSKETETMGTAETTVTAETMTGLSSSSETMMSKETSSTELTSEAITSSSETSETTESSSVSSEISTAESGSDETTIDIWSTMESEFSTASSFLEVVTKKCKPKKKKIVDCGKAEFGCCPDNSTLAKGPFNEGCSIIKTCEESKFKCCPDGVTPAKGKNNKGCPKSLCEQSLFGCCPDKFTPAEDDEQTGCPVLTTTVKDCSTSKYGCCPDGVSEAKGPKHKGCIEMTTAPIETHGLRITTPTTAAPSPQCSQTEFGCCSDNRTPASGPNQKGCEHCALQLFGCCDDGKTPAHGPNKEGCCLNSPYGCCPDNINEANGPGYQGCECTNTQFGCCPDKITTAKGPNNEGCGCEASTYGCCPDKITPAKGEKYEGCPCETHQFGCCPDGITIAEGPHHYGCYCSQSEFQCCPDGVTPAKGPNSEGCTCMESKFGCCPDGVTSATGKDFEGCENVVEPEQKACALPKDTGPCANFTIKYFFDANYGGCTRFWYGGCDGNGNRFDTEAACESVCASYEGKESCLLPKSSGPCAGYFKRYYYDSDRKQCLEFSYGGCMGNTNNFETIEECQRKCSVEESLPSCEQPVDRGPCDGNFERWYYDNETDTCRAFSFGGCKGNKNNYPTENACNFNCKRAELYKDICSMPKTVGNCDGQFAKWYFSRQDNKCMPFYYSGCDGNKNSFESLEKCMEKCPKSVAKSICEIPAEVGECTNYEARWYYDIKEQRCTQFYYGGCGGNGNNFKDESICTQTCKKETTERPTPEPEPEYFQKESCFLPYNEGNCRDYEIRWYYNSADGICSQFTYTGCGGNSNNFGSKEECENKCSYAQPTCSLPPIYGNCYENYTRWYYEERDQRCHEFIFSGCEGNRNNFFTEQECLNDCRPTPPETHACDDPLEAGNCDGSILSWYFDREYGTCRPFYYTGCGGNRNRFESQEDCAYQCGIASPVTSPNLCEYAERECQTIQCQYNVRRTYSSRGCYECTCENPCDGFNCPSGTVCVIDISTDSTSENRFIPVCRETDKPGDCPTSFENTPENCNVECYSDADCRGQSKCCSNGCGRICVNPELRTKPTTSTSQRPDYVEERPVKLEEKPQHEIDVDTSAGSYAVLRCYATGYPPPTITWRRGEVIINTNQGRYVLTSSGDLTIVQVHRADNGVYVCVADNGLGAPVSREVKLSVTEPKPTDAYIIGPKNTSVIATLNQPAVLRCPAGGYPLPIVSWWRGKDRLPLESPRFEVNRHFSLVFRSVQLQDLGVYTCEAYSGRGRPASIQRTLKAYGPVYITNEADRKYLKYIVNYPTVTARPNIEYPTRQPQVVYPQQPVQAVLRRDPSNTYRSGSDLVLYCDVDGYPTPNVTWTKDDVILTPSSRVEISTNPHRIVVHGISNEDSGIYACSARNTFSFKTHKESISIDEINVPPDCKDNQFFAKCDLIVKGRYCLNPYYAKFCCRSCTLAGQILQQHPNALI